MIIAFDILTPIDLVALVCFAGAWLFSLRPS